MIGFSRFINILRCSHPFSVILATSTGMIIASKIISETNQLLVLFSVFLLAQLTTGFINDYRDYEEDKIYQQSKPAIRLGIEPSDLKYSALTTSFFLIIVSAILLPLLGFITVIIGLTLAQSYNFGLKDTFASGFIFTGSFGLMMMVPIFYLDTFPYSIRFLTSGSCIGFVIHLVNAKLDLETDEKRGSKSMAVQLGLKTNLLLVAVLNLVVITLNPTSMIIICCTLIGLTAYFTHYQSYKIRELGYYISSFLSLLILYGLRV